MSEEINVLQSISIPTKSKEMSLRQVTAIARFVDLQRKQEKVDLSQGEVEAINMAISDITDIPRKQLMLTAEQMDKVGVAIAKAWEGVMSEYATILSKRITQRSFVVEKGHAHLLPEYKAVKKKSFRSLFRSKKKYSAPQEFKVGTPEGKPLPSLPFPIVSNIMDKAFNRIQKNRSKAETVYRDWLEIPKVLAAISWRKSEAVYIENSKGDPEVNYFRISEMEDYLLETNALVAFRVFAFFLSQYKAS